MAVSDFLIHTCSIKRPVPGVDSVGGETIASETTLYDTIPCCFQPTKAFQIYLYAQANIKVEFSVYFDREILAREGDYLYFNSERYVITGVRNLFNGYVRVCEVFVYRFGAVV